MPEDLLTIGEAAARAGVSVATIRHYESLGLLTSTRTHGNQRRLARSVLRRIAIIQAAQHVGLSLAEIREAFADFPSDHAPTKREWARLARRWRPRLDARITALEHLRDGLDMCIGCGCLSMRQCAIYNPADELAETGPGPRRVLTDATSSSTSHHR